PIGVQISGPNLGEVQVLALAHAYEQAAEWHLKRPSLQPDAKVPVLSRTAAGQTGEAADREDRLHLRARLRLYRATALTGRWHCGRKKKNMSRRSTRMNTDSWGAPLR